MKAHVQRVAHSRQSSLVYRVKADRRFARGWHCHPEYELTSIVRSQGRRLVGESVERYRSGDLVLLGPNVPHTWRSDAEDGSSRGSLHRAVVIQFREDFLGVGFWSAPELAQIESLLRRSRRGLQVGGRTRDEVARRMLAMREMAPIERLAELLRLLDLLARGDDDLRPLCNRIPPRLPDPARQRRFDRVLDYIHSGYQGQIEQSRAARLVGMTSSGFSRFFKRTTGRTFVAYLGELRIGHACELLTETDLPVLEISLRCGFNNLSNFNRRFLGLRGVTPSRYRARHARAVE